MKITDNIYQLSGLAFGTNSNTYAIDTGESIIIIDAGFSEYQWSVMKQTLKRWGLDKKRISHVFITHSHYDHAGNAWLAKAEGALIYAGESDAKGIETGDERTIGYMFGREFNACEVDYKLKNDERFEIGDKTIKAIHMPGHTEGSYMFMINDNGNVCIFLGDFIALQDKGPEDDVVVLLSWDGGPDYCERKYNNSLKRSVDFERMILMTGHGCPFYGNSQDVFKRAYQMSCNKLGKMDNNEKG